MKTQMDPGYVREFAAFLSGISEEITRLNAGITQDWLELSMTGWDDAQAAKFGNVLDQGIHAVAQFAEHADRYCSNLVRKAEHLERYLDR